MAVPTATNFPGKERERVPGKGKRYIAEFKEQAVRKVLDNSLPIAQLAVPQRWRPRTAQAGLGGPGPARYLARRHTEPGWAAGSMPNSPG